MSSLDPTTLGLRWEEVDGLPRRVHSADGTPLVRTSNDGRRISLVLPSRDEVALWLDAADHPVLGRCDAIHGSSGERLALSSRVDWRRPTRIPAVDRPGALPSGAGTAILNLLAWQAGHARVPALHYAGPYPSPALFDTLMSSFRVDEPRPTAMDRFIADAEAQALSGSPGGTGAEVPFRPAPHALSWPAPRVCVQRRSDRVDRVYIDGHAFDRSPAALRRLVAREDSLVALIALGEDPWCERLHLELDGTPRDRPRPLPSAPPSLVGTPLPSAVVNVLGEVVTRQAPRLLVPGLAALLRDLRWCWADLGETLVRCSGDRLELHAGMVPALPTDATTLLGVLTQLVEGPLRRTAAAILAAAWSSRHA